MLSACDRPQGTSFDEYLYESEDGLVRYKDNDELFTGETYMLVCLECSEPLFNHYPVHFVGQYKNGLKDGIFWISSSDRQDQYFDYRKRTAQKQLIYENGVLTVK